MCPFLCRILARSLTQESIPVALCVQEAMLDFRSGKAQVLVATDVAARGLHIWGLPYIINYDFPSRLEPYIHRVGRTGRLASTGHAFSFFTRNLAPLARSLLALLQVSLYPPLSCNLLPAGQVQPQAYAGQQTSRKLLSAHL